MGNRWSQVLIFCAAPFVAVLVAQVAGQQSRIGAGDNPDLAAEVASLRSSSAAILAQLSAQQSQLVPPGTMVPYFASTSPPAGYVWADGKTNWPDEPWVNEALRNKPVPDMTGGILIGGLKEDAAPGSVWSKGTLQMPPQEIPGSAFTVNSLDKWPVGPGRHGGANYTTSPFFVGMMRDTASKDVQLFLSRHGLGTTYAKWNKFLPANHLGGALVEPEPDFVEVAVDRKLVGHAGELGGKYELKYEALTIDSNANPPFLSCGWIIRMR